jgi:hypothetical protein
MFVLFSSIIIDIACWTLIYQPLSTLMLFCLSLYRNKILSSALRTSIAGLLLGGYYFLIYGSFFPVITMLTLLTFCILSINHFLHAESWKSAILITCMLLGIDTITHFIFYTYAA